MKKVITLILAIAIIFTFSFGTAFALPKGGGEAVYESVVDAQNSATKTVKSYIKLADYTAKGQAIINVAIAEALKGIAGAETIDDVNVAVDFYTGTVESNKVKAELVSDLSVKDAAAAAEKQLKEYWELIGVDENMEGNLYALYEDESKATRAELAHIETAYAEAEAVILAGKLGTGTVPKIQQAVDNVIGTLNAVYAKTLKEGREVPQDAIDWLQTKILEASETIKVAGIKSLPITPEGKANYEDYSPSVVSEYLLMVSEAQEKAQEVRTWDEFAEVYCRYIGNTTVGANTVINSVFSSIAPNVSNDEIIVSRTSLSEFQKIANRTKTKEVQIAAAEQILDKIGTYEYTDIKDISINESGDSEESWKNAENFIAELEYFKENGDWKKIDPTSLISTLTKKSTKTRISDVVISSYNIYSNFLKLKGVKETACDELSNYVIQLKKTGTYEVVSKTGKTEIDQLLEEAKALINACTRETGVDKLVKEYKNKMKSILTIEETFHKTAVLNYNTAFDKFIAEKNVAMIGKQITVDQQIYLNRIVSNLKKEYKEGTSNDVFTPDETVNGALTGISYNKATAIAYTEKTCKLYNINDYTPYTRVQIANEIAQFKGTINLDKYNTWAEFFAGYDSLSTKLKTYKTSAQEAYITAVAEAITTIASMGNPEDSEAFRGTMSRAKKAIEKVWDKESDLSLKNLADEDIVSKINIINLSIYENKKYEYDYLMYMTAQKAAGMSGVSAALNTTEFYALINDIVTLYEHYDIAEQLKISQIITNGEKAIQNAKTIDEKNRVAEEVIASIVAIEEKTDVKKYEGAIAQDKVSAVDYFNDYYGIAFSSEADTQLKMAGDIMNMQNKVFTFATVNTWITYIKSLDITAKIKAYKGYIKVSWVPKGNSLYINGYEVQRTVKKTSGFKKVFTTTAMTYKDTKSLKAGTRYYYRVRAYQTIGGVKYTSSWSNVVSIKAK